jgi:uncharacterized membrane protein (DUF485 family)
MPATSEELPSYSYQVVQASPEFAWLRRRQRLFVFPVTVGCLLWYLLYILLANYAPALMAAKITDFINVGMVLAILQFVTTFAIATIYVWYANRYLDPAAERLRQRIEKATAPTTGAQPAVDVFAMAGPARGEIQLQNVLWALADPVRLTAVRSLATDGETSSGALLAGMTKSAQSDHRRVLRESGIIWQRPSGGDVLLSLRSDDLDARFPGLLDAIVHNVNVGVAAATNGQVPDRPVRLLAAHPCGRAPAHRAGR